MRVCIRHPGILPRNQVNRLAQETSPYLLEHADNPVDWLPWGEEAINRARAEDRPILLSIGYSSCHWCHVMARESFADNATARVMNEYFVNVKVDREERPDLDRVYQLSHQALTGAVGGWPLTAFLDAQTLLPFFVGTYFPRRPRHGLAGFNDLLRRVTEVYAAKRVAVTAQGERLAAVLDQMEKDEAPEVGDDNALRKSAREALGEWYDPSEGGFGRAPKFPMPAAVERLLRHWADSTADGLQELPATRAPLARGADRPRRGVDQQALNMVLTTLTKMARGGIFDHVGGGFFRYATDRRWAIPHFEKMLGDNGVLLALYADALAIGPDPLFAHAARGTAEWLRREMQQPEGGYRAAQDADSEGGEGAFYVWRRDAVKRLLTEDEHLVAETLYGLDKRANFEGKWHLHRHDAWRAVVERLTMEPDRAETLLASAQAKLFAARAERTPPATDGKVLCGWNGLAIRGMALAGAGLAEPSWVDSATQAVDFIRARMVEDGRLRAVWTDGALGPNGLLDDHANLLHGLLALLGARWRDEDYTLALYLGDELLRRFEDERRGGFFLTPHDHERLIHRPKPVDDEALPPGNATAIRALAALGHLAGEARYLAAARHAGDWARSRVRQQPAGYCALITALDELARAPELVIVRGAEDTLGEWLAIARAGYHPRRHCYGIPYAARHTPAFLPPLGAAEERDRATAFVCRDFACSPPIRELAEFKKAMA